MGKRERAIALEGTGHAGADAALRDVVQSYEAAFPGRVRAYYLIGSFAAGDPVEISDLDLTVVFADAFRDDERARAEDLRRACGARSSVRLDMLVRDERSLHPLDVRLALNGRLVHGEDTRPRLPLSDPLAYRQWATETPLHVVIKHLRGGPPAAYPLDLPDPSAPLLGYDPPELAAYFYPPGQARGTKTLVVTACWLATATVALASGRIVGAKADAVAAYAADVGDEWAPFVAHVYERCRGAWRYRLPDDAAGAAELDAMCRAMPAFENRYLERHRAFVLDQLRSDDPEARRFAAQRLAWVTYRDAEVRGALERAADDADAEVRAGARRALGWIGEAPDTRRATSAGP